MKPIFSRNPWLTLTLMLLALPLNAANRTWTGAGGNNRWATGGNWNGGAVLAAGDNLAFNGASPLVMLNDLADGFDVGQITFSQAGYQVQGAPTLDLAGGVLASHGAGVSRVDAPVRLNAAAPVLSASGGAELELAGGIALNGRTAVFDGAGEVTVSGLITGAGAATAARRQGTGRTRLTRDNTYTGLTSVTGGILAVNGQQPSSGVSLAGGTLCGTGRVGNISTGAGGGTVCPGDPAGTLTAGSIFFNATVTLRFDLQSPALADQLVGTAGVTLGNAALALEFAPGYVPAEAEAHVLLRKDSVGVISGTFAGLPAGATVPVPGGKLAVINYGLGDGNDFGIIIGAPGSTRPLNLRFVQTAASGLPWRSASMRWDAPLGTGSGIADYQLYKNDIPIESSPDTFHVHDYLMPDTDYVFTVRTRETNGTLSAPSNALIYHAPRPAAPESTYAILVVPARLTGYTGEPLTTAQMEAVMTTGPFSLAAAHAEATLGQSVMDVDIHPGWQQLPKTGEEYGGFIINQGALGDLWYGMNMNTILADLTALLPAGTMDPYDLVLVPIHGMGTVGLSGGKFTWVSANQAFVLNVILHEAYHSIFHFLHSAGWDGCNGLNDYFVSPTLDDPNFDACMTGRYTGSWDVMGAGTDRSISAWHREMAGIIGAAHTAIANADGLYALEALNVAPAAGLKSIKVPLGGENFYIAGYRKPTGFDGPGTANAMPAPIDGIVVWLRPGRFPGTDCDQILVKRQLINPGDAFVDPYRHVRIELVSKAGNTATVRVTGFAIPFTAISANISGGNAAVTFNGLSGARYKLQTGSGLNNWTDAIVGIAGTNGPVTRNVPASAAREFFRVIVQDRLTP